MGLQELWCERGAAVPVHDRCSACCLQVSCSRAGHTLWVHTGRRGQGQLVSGWTQLNVSPRKPSLPSLDLTPCASWEYASSVGNPKKNPASLAFFPQSSPHCLAQFCLCADPQDCSPSDGALSPKPSMAPQYPQFKVQKSFLDLNPPSQSGHAHFLLFLLQISRNLLLIPPHLTLMLLPLEMHPPPTSSKKPSLISLHISSRHLPLLVQAYPCLAVSSTALGTPEPAQSRKP